MFGFKGGPQPGSQQQADNEITPEEAERRRQRWAMRRGRIGYGLARQALTPKQINHPLQALGQLAQAGAAGVMMREGDKAEAKYTADRQQVMEDLIRAIGRR